MTVPMRPSQIAFWPLDRLKPYARNAKTHDADQVARIAASMAEFGWTENGGAKLDHGSAAILTVRAA